MTKDLEARLLASVPSIGHFQRLEELGIVEGSFQHYGPMYRYIGQIVAEHGHLPRLRDLQATFNIGQFVQRKPLEYDWLLGEFIKLTTVQRIQQVMDSNVEKHGEDPRELLPALVRDLTQLMLPSDHQASLTDTGALRRVDEYEAKIPPQGGSMIVGIPTGLRYFDADARLGWLPGELIGIVGRLYIGKSWMLLYHGAIAWMAGYRVLLLSPEMPSEEAEARFDTLVCGLHGLQVDVQDLYRGYHPSPEHRKIAAKIAARGDWVTLSSAEGHAFRLHEIPRLVRQFSPQLLLIDGLALLGGTTGRSQLWEQIKELSTGLKNLAVGMNISVLVSHQANRGAQNTSRPPGLHEVSYGDSFAQFCDRVLALSRPERTPQQLRVTVQKFRRGEHNPAGSIFRFDPGHGQIEETTDALDTRTARRNGDQREDVQERQGDLDLLPIP